MSFKQEYYTEKEFDEIMRYVSDYLKDYNAQKKGIDVRNCSHINPEIVIFSDTGGELAFSTIGMGANAMESDDEETRHTEIVAYASSFVSMDSKEFKTIVEEITGLCNYPFEFHICLTSEHIVKLSKGFEETFRYSHVMFFPIFEPLWLNEKKLNFLMFIPLYRKEAEWIKSNTDGAMRFIMRYMSSFDLNENDMARIDIIRDEIIPDPMA